METLLNLSTVETLGNLTTYLTLFLFFRPVQEGSVCVVRDKVACVKHVQQVFNLDRQSGEAVCESGLVLFHANGRL
jgi:hypothetical protein